MSSDPVDPYTVRVTAGTLITTDDAAKQIILHLDEARPPATKFVIKDIDDEHVLVKSAYLDEIKALVGQEFKKHVYSKDEEMLKAAIAMKRWREKEL